MSTRVFIYLFLAILRVAPITIWLGWKVYSISRAYMNPSYTSIWSCALLVGYALGFCG